MKKWLSVLLCAAVGCFAEELSTLQNGLVKTVVTERGGKLNSLVDCVSKHDYAAQDTVFGGCGKARDILLKNVEPMVALYKLEKPADGVVKATLSIEGTNLDGMKLVRTFSLAPDTSMVNVLERWNCAKEKNNFAVNIHNYLNLGENVIYYAPSLSGLTETTAAQAVTNDDNYILDISQPWIAALDSETGRGLALYVEKASQLDRIYFWRNRTMEVCFLPATLTADVAVDIWEVPYSLICFAGQGKVVSVTPQAVLSMDGRKATVYFPKSAGKCQVAFEEKALGTVDVKAGNSYRFDAPKAGTLTFTTAFSQFSVNIPGDIKLNTVQTSAPPAKEMGVNGIYAYYPVLWFSREVESCLAFGLRGDFSAKKNLRCELVLPPQININYSFTNYMEKKNIEVNGKPMVCHVLQPVIPHTWDQALQLDLQLTKELPEDAAGTVRCVWDGGEQTAERFQLKMLPKLPDIGQKLKYFSIAFGDWSGQPTPDWNKYGVTIFEFWDRYILDFYAAYHGPDFYKDRLTRHRGAGYECSIEMFWLYGMSRTILGGHPGELARKFAGTFFYPEKQEGTVDLMEVQALLKDGTPAGCVCPSYRGRYWDKMLDTFKIARAYGFRHIDFDDETWIRGSELCHCPRCLKQFGKDPEKYPKEWMEFKTDQVADLYRRIRELLGDEIEIGTWLDPYPDGSSVTYRLTDWRKIARHVDTIYPMLYTPISEEIGKYARNYAEIQKNGRADVIIGLAPNCLWEYHNVLGGNYASLDAPRQQLLEAVFGGCKGIRFYAHRYTTGGGYLPFSLARGVQDLLPVEEIIAKGKQVTVATSNPDVLVTAYEYNGEIAIFARDYNRGVVKTTVCGQNLLFDQERVAVFKVKK